MADQTVTVDGQAHTMTPPSPQIGIDDQITFKVINKDCWIYFHPRNIFGRRLRLKVGEQGPYSASVNPPPPPPTVSVDYCIVDINRTCDPAAVKSPGVTSYSIKVG
jgi:hypothetical protein